MEKLLISSVMNRLEKRNGLRIWNGLQSSLNAKKAQYDPIYGFGDQPVGSCGFGRCTE
jgi:hypothetical protein